VATYSQLKKEQLQLTTLINTNKLMLIILMVIHHHLKKDFYPQIEKKINTLANEDNRILSLEKKINYYLILLKENKQENVFFNSLEKDIEKNLLVSEGKLFFDWFSKNIQLNNSINTVLSNLSKATLGQLNEKYFRENIHLKSKLSSLQHSLLTIQKKTKK
jgi:hypothetical protein